jgi:hypothetical protein
VDETVVGAPLGTIMTIVGAVGVIIGFYCS